MADMKGLVERTGKRMTKAVEENILLAEKMRLKQLKVIAKTYEDERAETLQVNRLLQEQLNLAKTKCDEVHTKLDKYDELSTNRSAQLNNMQAVLMNITQSNIVLVQMLQTKDDQLMNKMTKLDDRSAELIEVTD
jgi:hypothetical protein